MFIKKMQMRISERRPQWTSCFIYRVCRPKPKSKGGESNAKEISDVSFAFTLRCQRRRELSQLTS